jgi:protein involved in polysaccharide export with SLBB domain
VVVKRVAFLAMCLALSVAALPARAARHPTPVDTSQTDWTQVPEYRIGPGDLLRFNFGPGTANDLDLVRSATVRPDGRVTVYPVGDVLAAGRTPSELQAALVELLAAEMKQPRVTVEVEKMAAALVYVLGQVRKPGSQPIGPFTTLLQVISDAGGFETDAARNSVLIMHRAGVGDVNVSRVRADRLLKGAGDVPISRYDIVYVPRSAIGNVDVFVEQFFGRTKTALDFSYVGWELFHLNRILYTNRNPAQ